MNKLIFIISNEYFFSEKVINKQQSKEIYSKYQFELETQKEDQQIYFQFNQFIDKSNENEYITSKLIFKEFIKKPNEYLYYSCSFDKKNTIILSSEQLISIYLKNHFVSLQQKYQIHEITIDVSLYFKYLSKEQLSIMSSRFTDIIEMIKSDNNLKHIQFQQINTFHYHSITEIQQVNQYNENTQIQFHQQSNTLTGNELHIVSKYFESFQDYFHLEMSTKKCKGNCERFRFNPLSITSETIYFFPNIKFLHLYFPSDKIITDKNIKKIINWNRIGYYESEKLTTEMEHLSIGIECKRIVYTKQDKRFDYTREINKSRKKRKSNSQFNNEEYDIDNQIDQDLSQSNSLEIPIGVKEIEDECFKNTSKLMSIEIPSTVTSIGLHCFDDCTTITSITFPLVLTTFDSDYKAFFHWNGKLSSFSFPSSLQQLNEREIHSKENQSSFTIPSIITSLSDRCFSDCFHLQTLELSSSLKSLPDLCFLNCSSLSSIKGIEHISEIGIECFMNCPFIQSLPKHIQITRNEILSKEEKKLLEEWTQLTCSEIIFDTTIHDWSINTSLFDEMIMNKSQLLFVITESSGEKFGYYLSTPITHYMSAKVGKHETNSQSFLFNIESKGRLQSPMKFEILDIKSPYSLYKKQSDHLITLGGYEQIKLYKKNMRENCRCNQYNKVFDYHGIKTAVSGRNPKNPFILIRLVVYQMK